MNDYIKRDEALSFPFANGPYDHKNANEHFIFGCESYKEWLEDLPIADVRENVHGEWIDTGSGEECSVCHEIQYGYDSGRRFCASCGAIMDGGDDE